MDFFESNLEKTCAWCGCELGFRRYKKSLVSNKRFCTIPHLEAHAARQEQLAQAKIAQQAATFGQRIAGFGIVQGGKP